MNELEMLLAALQRALPTITTNAYLIRKITSLIEYLEMELNEDYKGGQ